MNDFVIRGNIRLFEQKLKAAQDEHQRRVLQDLLAAEHKRLEREASLES